MNELANNIEDKINNVICVTRFNDETYAQFEEHLNERICLKTLNAPENVSQVYNTPLPIAESLKFDKKYFLVIEMLNSKNLITGISVIKNRSYFKKFKIYNDQNYNRYSYKICKRMSRYEILALESELLKVLETLIFTEKNHLKRGQGIQYINSNYYKKLHKKFHHLESLESNEIEKYLIKKIRNIINDKNYT